MGRKDTPVPFVIRRSLELQAAVEEKDAREIVYKIYFVSRLLHRIEKPCETFILFELGPVTGAMATWSGNARKEKPRPAGKNKNREFNKYYDILQYTDNAEREHAFF